MKAIPGEKNEGKENKRGNMYRQMMTVLKLVEGRYSTHKKFKTMVIQKTIETPGNGGRI